MLIRYWRGFLGRCPHCGKGHFAKGLFATHPHCSQCGLVYANAPGDFTGAAALGYGVVSLPILMVGMLMVSFTDLSLPAIMGIGFVLILLLSVAVHQPIKGLWLAFLVDSEALLPPER